MHKNIFTIVFLSLLILAQGCSMLENAEPREKKADETYLKYASISSAKKEMILREDFINNSRNWRVIHTFQYRIAIENGLLVMHSDYSGSARSTISVNTFTGSDNFEIEASIREDFINHTEIRNRLIWEFNASTNKYRYFEIDDYNRRFYIGAFSNGYEKLYYYSNSNWQGKYNQGEFNKYTIRKIDNVYYYFVNETFIYQEPFSSFNGFGIGFQVGNYNTLSVEYLTISKLNK